MFSNILASYEAARVSLPYQLNEHRDQAGNLLRLTWKVNLLATKKHWLPWFDGISKLANASKVPIVAIVNNLDNVEPLYVGFTTVPHTPSFNH